MRKVKEELDVPARRAIWHLVWTVPIWSRSQSETAAGGGLLDCWVVLLAIAHCLRKKQPWVADVLPTSSFSVLFSSPHNDFKLEKLPEYLRDTVDWLMG